MEELLKVASHPRSRGSIRDQVRSLDGPVTPGREAHVTTPHPRTQTQSQHRRESRGTTGFPEERQRLWDSPRSTSCGEKIL